jgi:4-amino-4-deoxy-L-arabinose transferase-like glycosyltransferase
MHARDLLLALILLVFLVLATLYAVNVPAWQAPDEPAHYNYIHELAATGQFPVLRMGDYDEAYIRLLTSQRFPPELSIEPLRYEAHQPPLYYLLGAAVFRLADGGLLPLRLLSVALGVLFIILVYAIVRLIFPRQPALALGAAAFTAFLPMHVAQAASVNNDALAEVLLAAIMLLSIRYVKLALLGPRSPARSDALAIGLLLGLALVTKVSAYVAIPVALAAPLIAWYESRRPSPICHSPFTNSLIHQFALILLPALLLALPWYIRNAQIYGNLDILGRSWHDAVVIGQLTTGELLAQVGLAGVLERFLVWSHASFWGVFGWMGVWMDARVYTAALAFGVAVVAGCMWQVADRRLSGAKVSGVRVSGVKDRKSASRFTFHVSRFQTWALALLALSALGTLGIYITYNLLFVQPQGRYLFPALPAISLAAAVGWWTVARRPGAARWAGIALLGAAGLAVLWGLSNEGINKWSLLIFAGGATLLLVWGLMLPRLTGAARVGVTLVAYALPFAAMAGLSLLALSVFVLPQLS